MMVSTTDRRILDSNARAHYEIVPVAAWNKIAVGVKISKVSIGMTPGDEELQKEIFRQRVVRFKKSFDPTKTRKEPTQSDWHQLGTRSVHHRGTYRRH